MWCCPEKENSERIVESLLMTWYTVEHFWLKNRTLRVFEDSFDREFHSEVMEMGLKMLGQRVFPAGKCV